jgi:DNA-binding winged helix-turn-helix (wHTH) protein
VRIGGRALAILTVLIEGAGDIVTKEKLIAATWPSTFVDDSNLKVNVSNLRRALGSHDSGQDYIATVPGRGYRLIAPVHRISMGAGGLSPKIPPIGRADDLAAVQEGLSKNSVVTVVGTDGIGKTALATAAAHAVAAHYPDGVSFVDLAKISAVQFIPTALAFALGLSTGGEDPLAGVIHALDWPEPSIVRSGGQGPDRHSEGVMGRAPAPKWRAEVRLHSSIFQVPCGVRSLGAPRSQARTVAQWMTRTAR